MLNIRIVSWSLGIFTAISFVLCVIYGLIVPPSLHYMAPFLEMVPECGQQSRSSGRTAVGWSAFHLGDKRAVAEQYCWRSLWLLGGKR